jgi:hypothetical protein
MALSYNILALLHSHLEYHQFRNGLKFRLNPEPKYRLRSNYRRIMGFYSCLKAASKVLIPYPSISEAPNP